MEPSLIPENATPEHYSSRASQGTGREVCDQFRRPRLEPVGRAARRRKEVIDRPGELLSVSVRDRAMADVPVSVYVSRERDSSLKIGFSRPDRVQRPHRPREL